MAFRVRATALAILAAGLLASSQLSAAAAQPRLPDLGMARLDDLTVTKTEDGRQLLRFSATIVNVGEERFQLLATRSSTSSDFTALQRVFNADGSHMDVPVDARFVFGGDGHGHWHVRDLESYELERIDNGAKVGTGAKSGFCFFDTTPYRLSLPGAPSSPQFDSSGCGEEPSRELSMGLSVGWGDRYAWTLPDQFIDITGLGKGRYRLTATADAPGVFAESDRTNNATWVDLSLSNRRGGLTVKVHGYGPAA